MLKTIAPIVVSISIVAAAIVLIDCTCVHPYTCNLIERAAKVQTDAAWDLAERTADTSRSAIAGRRILASVEPCLTRCTGNADLYMIAAADSRLLGRFEDAVAYYNQALAHDRRPEIYFNLGITEVALGRREDAIAHLVTAGKSGMYTNMIDDALLRQEVERRLALPAKPRL